MDANRLRNCFSCADLFLPYIAFTDQCHLSADGICHGGVIAQDPAASHHSCIGTYGQPARNHDGRSTVLSWAPDSVPMDVIASMRRPVPIHRLIANPGGMKERKSKLLRDVLTEINNPRCQSVPREAPGAIRAGQ